MITDLYTVNFQTKYYHQILSVQVLALVGILFGGTAPLLSAHFVSKGFMIAPGILVLIYGMIAVLTMTKNYKLEQYGN